MIEQPGHKKRGLRQAAAHNAGPCVRAPSEAPPRAPAPVAAGASPRPPLAPCARTSPATRTAQAFRAPAGRKKRASPHRHAHHPGANLPAPSLRGLESRSSPKCIPNPRCLPQIFDLEKASRASAGQAARFQRAACLADMRGGFGSLAQARLPYAASRPGALRRRARGKRRTPGGKDRRQPGFSDALYSIIASASLTSSIRRATCAGVSTGWLNSTVWFTVTAGAAACAACAVRWPS